MTPLLRLILSGFFLAALGGCSAGGTEADLSPLRVQTTAATRLWLADVQTCAGARPLQAVLAAPAAIDPQAFDLGISLGAPVLPYPAYEIGQETIHLVVSSQNPVSAISGEQAAGIYSGLLRDWSELDEDGGAIQVWAYPAGEEVQTIFEQSALSGRSPVSDARLAMDPETMRAAVAADPAAIGILPGAWLTGEVRSVLTIASVPVLAFPAEDAADSTLAILSCLQAR